ncbi:unnamed protein product [Lactuca saligna]|uniref:Uncharacterized protein n=1 Tax=Lactuca saligna TaxID=75948 RepID=A0AA35Y873_LACSI|nr:unnamed protein product [Lactuca saligna]
MRFLMAKTPEQRVDVDLDTHYTQLRFHSFIPYHMMMMLILSIIQSYIQFEPYPMYLCRNILNNILELKQEDRYYIRDMWKGYQLLGCSQIMGLMARSTPAAFLLQQGVGVKGLAKSSTATAEVPPLLEENGKIEVWRINGNAKTTVPKEDIGKLYSGDCYIVLYTYHSNEKKEDYYLCCWIGKDSIEGRVFQGKEPPQFVAIFQPMVVLKAGLSSGYKNSIADKELNDETYTLDGVALIQIFGTSPHNNKVVQVDDVATSLNTSECFLHYLKAIKKKIDEVVEEAVEFVDESRAPSRSQLLENVFADPRGFGIGPDGSYRCEDPKFTEGTAQVCYFTRVVKVADVAGILRTKSPNLFRQLGLMHIFVVPRASRVIGMITRKDLIFESVDYGHMAEILVQRASSPDEFTS